MAETLLAELARLLPDKDYVRVRHAPSQTIAFADYELGLGLWVCLDTDEEVEFVPPVATARPWDQAVDRLYGAAA
jgi:hypothetical protein